ncbi:PH domain-containing protein [Microbacterium sp.]|uniref:PH domain-containing protein n=1 Tax=Microbacterium sp. TaxID=51671 RepID=UPI002810E2EF|nr:PH domain-containing protein [Microbacterium sp.]
MSPATFVYRPPGGYLLVAIGALLVGMLLWDAVARSGVREALLIAPWPLLALWAGYLVASAGIRADADGVEVRNPLRRILVPWGRVQKVAMRWQVELMLEDGAIVRCFGGPAIARPRRLGPERRLEDAGHTGEDVVAELRRRKAEHSGRQHASGAVGTVHGAGSDEPVHRRWDWVAVAVTVGLIVWAAAVAALAYA